MIPYTRHTITEEDVQAVNEALRSSHITRGQYVDAFESDLASFTGSPYVTVVSSGTAALYLAYRALGVTAGDRVWSSPITFAATTNAAMLCSATPDFVDIEWESANMDLVQLEKKLNAIPKDRLPSVVTITSYAGRPVAVDRLKKLGILFGFRVVIDQSHALGSQWKDAGNKWNRAGSGLFADIEITSFQASKNMTTGEGGAVFTRDEQLHQDIRMLRNHGFKTENWGTLFPDDQPEASDGDATQCYDVEQPGFNFHLTDFQAALGRSQLSMLQERNQQRRQLAMHYNSRFSDLKMLYLPNLDETEFISSWHLYVIRTPYRWKLYKHLKDNGIHTQIHYPPLHLNQWYKENYNFEEGNFPLSERHAGEALSLPLYPALQPAGQKQVIEAIRSFFA